MEFLSALNDSIKNSLYIGPLIKTRWTKHAVTWNVNRYFPSWYSINFNDLSLHLSAIETFFQIYKIVIFKSCKTLSSFPYRVTLMVSQIYKFFGREKNKRWKTIKYQTGEIFMTRNPGSVNSRSRKKVTRLLRKCKRKQNYLNNWLLNLDQRDFSVIRERRKK